RGGGSVQAVGWAALLLVAATLSTEVPRVGKRWWLKYADTRIRTEIRADALAHVLRRWPMERLHREPVGDLMARIVADVEVMGPGVRELIVETWDTLLLEVSLFVALLAYDWRLSLLVALPVPFGLYLGGRVGGAMRRRTYAARLANGVLTAALQEALAGLRLLRLFGREEATAARIARHSEEYARSNLAVTRLRGGLAPIYGFVMTSGIVALLWLGGQEVVAGSLTVGAFVAYLDLYLRFIGRTPRVPQMVNAVQTSAAAFSRLEPLLLPDPPRPRGAGWRETLWSGFVEGAGELDGPGPGVAVAEGTPRGRVELRGVTFRYPSSPAPVVTDLSLEVAPGELVAVTGPVGSGKSALARALLGLYPLDAGQVLLDGRD
ncbi:MAG: ABC transporter ATP-binding protein, partial [Longimicrobiales bacterium]|nr:ABC transporter ATP-binding protein [Longimicrobiales bacterium]